MNFLHKIPSHSYSLLMDGMSMRHPLKFHATLRLCEYLTLLMLSLYHVLTDIGVDYCFGKIREKISYSWIQTILLAVGHSTLSITRLLKTMKILSLTVLSACKCTECLDVTEFLFYSELVKLFL